MVREKRELEPRKLPRQARARATRSAIVEAAAQVLSKAGLSGFNTNAVAARAGVSVGSLYQYFPNKDALMVALIRRQQAEQTAAVAEALAEGPGADLAATVRRVVRAAMAHHRKDSLLAAAIDHEEARLPLAAELEANLMRAGGMLHGLLQMHGKAMDAADFAIAERTLPAMVRAVVDSWANLDPPQLERAEDEAVRAVLGYISFRAPAPSIRSSSWPQDRGGPRRRPAADRSGPR